MIQGKASRARTLIGLLAVLWLVWTVVGSSSASAAEPITIREILDAPKSFHLKQVTLQGTVRNVTPLDPYKLQSGTTCGELESTKSVSDIYAPVSGTVVARNESLDATPELVNNDPYGGGWLFDVTVSDASSLDALLDSAAYQASLES